jgi:hypothetical protein
MMSHWQQLIEERLEKEQLSLIARHDLELLPASRWSPSPTRAPGRDKATPRLADRHQLSWAVVVNASARNLLSIGEECAVTTRREWPGRKADVAGSGELFDAQHAAVRQRPTASFITTAIQGARSRRL